MPLPIALNLFLNYNQKHYYISLLNKLYEVFICVHAAGSRKSTWKSMRQNARCYNWAILAAVLHTTFVLELKIKDFIILPRLRMFLIFLLSRNEPRALIKLKSVSEKLLLFHVKVPDWSSRRIRPVGGDRWMYRCLQGLPDVGDFFLELFDQNNAF